MIPRFSILPLLILVACADTGTDENGNSRGDLRVTFTTTGTNLDPNGYDVSIDLATPVTIGSNGSYLFEGLLSGPHQMAISGFAANCDLAGDNPRTVGVVTNQETQVAVSVTCT